jgi:hypothetical protein
MFVVLVSLVNSCNLVNIIIISGVISTNSICLGTTLEL